VVSFTLRSHTKVVKLFLNVLILIFRQEKNEMKNWNAGDGSDLRYMWQVTSWRPWSRALPSATSLFRFTYCMRHPTESSLGGQCCHPCVHRSTVLSIRESKQACTSTIEDGPGNELYFIMFQRCLSCLSYDAWKLRRCDDCVSRNEIDVGWSIFVVF